MEKNKLQKEKKVCLVPHLTCSDYKFFIELLLRITFGNKVLEERSVVTFLWGGAPKWPNWKLDFFLEGMLMNGIDFENMDIGPYRNGSKGMLS